MDNKNTLSAVLDGTSIDVQHVDGALTKDLRIRKIPLRDLPKLGRVWGNEADEVALYADKTPAWVEKLTEESFEAAIEEGRRLNFQSFKRYFARQSQVIEALGQNPAITEMLSKVAKDLAASESQKLSKS